jgi:N-acetylgalactosamine-6-sulfatase
MKDFARRGVLAVVLCLLAGFAFAAEPSRPNVLFILADDLGWGDLSCHGNKLVKTPNIDRLAREGTDFHQFNVMNPVCSPSRTAFTTGKFPARFGIHEAIGGIDKNVEVRQVDWLDPRAVTLPRLLKSAGYVTGHVGKWHLCSHQADESPLPADYGFDEHALFQGTSPPRTPQHTTEREVFDAAIAFLKKHREQPFYLNVWCHQTHLAHYPTEESLKELASLDEKQRVYSAAALDADRGIGKILDTLRELGLESNTLVFFSSDNGPENNNPRQTELRDGYGGAYSVGATGGLRGRKRSLYEGGVRTPLIVRWPGHVPAGRVETAASLASVDFLPTICSVANVSLPPGFVGDGENVLDALEGRSWKRTKPLFWDWRGSQTPAHCWPRWAVRSGDWKLLTDDGTRVELYRVSEDRAEEHDVAKVNNEVVQRLTADLTAWRATLPKEPPKEFLSAKRAGAEATAKKAKRKK